MGPTGWCSGGRQGAGQRGLWGPQRGLYLTCDGLDGAWEMSSVLRTLESVLPSLSLPTVNRILGNRSLRPPSSYTIRRTLSPTQGGDLEGDSEARPLRNGGPSWRPPGPAS